MEPDPQGTAVARTAVLVEALSRGLPADRVVVDPDVLGAMSHDDAEWAPVGPAAAPDYADRLGLDRQE